MSSFFNVKVEFTVDGPKGKPKKEKVSYLVDAVSVTDAEATTVAHLTEDGESEFEVKSVTESKIVKVITPKKAEVKVTVSAKQFVD